MLLQLKISNLIWNRASRGNILNNLKQINLFLLSFFSGLYQHELFDFYCCLLLRPLITLNEVSEKFPVVFQIPDVYMVSICCRLPSEIGRMVDCFTEALFKSDIYWGMCSHFRCLMWFGRRVWQINTYCARILKIPTCNSAVHFQATIMEINDLSLHPVKQWSHLYSEVKIIGALTVPQLMFFGTQHLK